MSLVLQADLQDNAASTTVLATVGTNGTLQNSGNTSASSVTGPGYALQKGLSVDGINDRFNFGNQFSPGPTQAFSLSLWIKPSNATPAATQLLIDKIQDSNPFPGFVLLISGTVANDPFDFVFQGSGHQIDVRFPSTLSTNWMHLVATYDGSCTAAGVAMYKNGVSLTPTIITNTLTSGDTTQHAFSMCLGDRFDGPLSPWGGSMSGFRIYTNALTATEVLALYQLVTGIGPRRDFISGGGTL